ESADAPRARTSRQPTETPVTDSTAASRASGMFVAAPEAQPALAEFDAFVRARTPALLRSAFLLTGDQHLAEDLVQTALARCHRSWRRLHDAGNAEAYTRRVMYNLQIAWWRRHRVPESLSGQLPERPARADHATAAAVWLTLRPALLRLTPKQRAVLVLRFFED